MPNNNVPIFSLTHLVMSGRVPQDELADSIRKFFFLPEAKTFKPILKISFADSCNIPRGMEITFGWDTCTYYIEEIKKSVFNGI
jgi:hypothetical protein